MIIIVDYYRMIIVVDYRMIVFFIYVFFNSREFTFWKLVIVIFNAKHAGEKIQQTF